MDVWRVSHSSDFSFTGDFTVEGWVYQTSRPEAAQLIQKGGREIDRFPHWAVSISAAGVLQAQLGRAQNTASRVLITGSTSVSLNAWHHYAFVRDGSTVYLFLDGVSQGSAAVSITPADISSDLTIGGYENQAATAYLNRLVGYQDDIRVTQGVGRYTAAFTPPVAQFPDA